MEYIHKQHEQSCLLNVNEIKSAKSYLEERCLKHQQKFLAKKQMSFRSRFYDIFPTKWLFLFFISYTLIYIIGAILVRFSANNSLKPLNETFENSTAQNSSYSYDTVSAVLTTEFVKLILNTFLFLLSGGNIIEYFRSIYRHREMILYYFIPSGLYGFYNNLTFVSLSIMDPATYYILLQFRIVVTAVVYQTLFKRDLSRIQWLSLGLLTVGCIIKQWPTSSSSTNSIINSNHFSLIIIAIQIFCSCFAGVYNEYLLKNKQNNIGQVNLFVQNVYMYFDSIIVNFFIVFARYMFSYDSQHSSFSMDMSMFQNPLVIAIILTNAFCGLSTSYFIKAFNSIMKSYATSLELLLTALICWALFAIPINLPAVFSIFIVSYATYLFAKHPVISK